MNRVALLTLAVAFNVSAGPIVQQSGNGSQPFGPNETQTQACELAFSKAKQNALKAHFGELISQQSVVQCDDVIQSNTGNDCELFESTWSSINANGYVKNVTNKNESITFSEALKARLCEVSAIFEIEEFEGIPDYSFETEVSLTNGRTLRVTDSPRIRIESNFPAFHYVYFWAPYEDKNNYYRLFPNAIDQQSKAMKQLQIPSNEATKQYELEVSLPIGLSFSNEYLVVYSSKEQIPNAPEKITETGLFNWLQSINRTLWTQDKISYRIIGDST